MLPISFGLLNVFSCVSIVSLKIILILRLLGKDYFQVGENQAWTMSFTVAKTS